MISSAHDNQARVSFGAAQTPEQAREQRIAQVAAFRETFSPLTGRDTLAKLLLDLRLLDRIENEEQRAAHNTAVHMLDQLGMLTDAREFKAMRAIVDVLLEIPTELHEKLDREAKALEERRRAGGG